MNRVRLGIENADMPLPGIVHRLLPPHAGILVLYMPYWAYVILCFAVSILRSLIIRYGTAEHAIAFQHLIVERSEAPGSPSPVGAEDGQP